MGVERRVSPATQVLRCCEACGQPIDDEEVMVELDGLQVAGNALIYQGNVRSVIRGTIVLIRMLMLRGRVSKEAFLIATNSEAERSTCNTYICYLRAALRELNVPLNVVTVHGWGYELRRPDGSGVTEAMRAADATGGANSMGIDARRNSRGHTASKEGGLPAKQGWGLTR